MCQNFIEPYIVRDLKYKAENIDKLLEWALEKENQKVCDKYSNISNTVKILKNLMIEFNKKADSLEKSLLAATRIQETEFQSQYYQKQIAKCEQLSKSLHEQIKQKSTNIQYKQAQANTLKKQLMRIKTENIKVNMKICDIERDYDRTIDKEMSIAEKDKRRKKIEEDRKLITTNVFKKSSSIRDQYEQIELELFVKIDQAKQLRQFIESCFKAYRDRLKKQEKKSNIYGLAGSMLFKLEGKQNREQILPKIKSNGGEARLMVYDVLKQKYRKHIKMENKKKQELIITEDEFMKFTPLQIIGIIELKGGVNQIINKKLTGPFGIGGESVKYEVDFVKGD